MPQGVIGYYGRHYIAYFKSFNVDSWVLFDDANVKAVCTACVGRVSRLVCTG